MNTKQDLSFFEEKIEQLIEQKLQAVFDDPTLTFDKTHFTGGLTNYNYLMTIHGQDYVIREPGKLTDRMIDRQSEQQNNKIASELGINSKTIYFDAETGIKFSSFLPNSKNLAQSNPFSHDSIQGIVKILSKLHQHSVSFANFFDWEKELKKYEHVIQQLKGSLFYDYSTRKKELLDFFEQYIRIDEWVCCHNDTVPENFLVTPSKEYYLIDWEYSGMNDPNWDLAAFMIETRLPQESIKDLIDSYYPNGLTTENELKIKGFMMAQDLLWTVWALIRHYCGDNFLEYCEMRYDRFKKNIDQLTKDINFPLAKMVIY